MPRFLPRSLKFWANDSVVLPGYSMRVTRLQPRNFKQFLWVTCFLPILLWVNSAIAEPSWKLCPPQDFLVPETTVNSADQSTRISADDVTGRYDDAIQFQGNVILEQAGRQIEATDVTITKDKNIEARGGIRASDGKLDVRAAQAVFEEKNKLSHFTDVEYTYKPRHAYGKADEIKTVGNISTLKNSTYSTCPAKKNGWEIKARKITLDRDKGLGTAKNAVFRFKDIPFFYLPTVTFPISGERKTGFLFPQFGRGDPTGAELELPFYWNIAPQYDATITPRIMSKRGVMLQNEFRYLSARHKGSLQVNYLPNDNKTDEDRELFALHHAGKPGKKWQLNLDGSHVSDDDYLDDFGNSLRLGSISHLQRQADLRYSDRWFTFAALGRAYQTIDPNISDTDKPYRLLPQLDFRATLPKDFHGLALSLDSQYTRFSHSVNVNGDRLDIVPRLSWRKDAPAWFFQPAFSWHYTQYDLDNLDLERNLPVVSLDSGLFFERFTENDNIQTLEPRLFYLYAPLRQQDNIPLFDTSEPVFNFPSLFRENRFSGRDRVGDASQLTFALTSRHLDSNSGQENWRASIGQILYFKDREVSLNNTAPETDTRSSFAAELSYTPGTKWVARSTIVASEDLNETERFNLTLGYRGNNRRLANLEHIYRRDDLQQTGISFGWPLNQRWRLLGRWLYSHDESRDIDILGGLEYESCCWKARLVGQRYVTDDENEYNDNISLQLVFKGLASFGEGSQLLQERITGYETDDE